MTVEYDKEGKMSSPCVGCETETCRVRRREARIKSVTLEDGRVISMLRPLSREEIRRRKNKHNNLPRCYDFHFWLCHNKTPRAFFSRVRVAKKIRYSWGVTQHNIWTLQERAEYGR